MYKQESVASLFSKHVVNKLQMLTIFAKKNKKSMYIPIRGSDNISNREKIKLLIKRFYCLI